MAIQHIATIACDNLLRSFDGRLSFIGTFRNIFSPIVPITKAPFGIYVEIMGDPGDSFRVSIEGLGLDLVLAEGEIESTPLSMEFQQAAMNIAGEIGVQFEHYGVFEVIVRSKDQIIHKTAFGVIHPSMPIQGEAANASQ